LLWIWRSRKRRVVKGESIRQSASLPGRADSIAGPFFLRLVVYSFDDANADVQGGRVSLKTRLG